MRWIAADYHLHTNISPDGRNSMDEMCEKAIKMGFSELAFTDHYEIFTPDFKGSVYSPLDRFTIRYLEQYFERLNACRLKYKRKIAVKSGIELGQPQVNKALSDKLLKQFSFDVVLGSMHKINNTDLSEHNYAGRDNGKFEEQNYKMIYDMASAGDFDVFAHLDLIKRYSARYGKTVSIIKFPDRLDTILEKLISRGKLLEINTSGLRQPLNEAIPGLAILKRYKSLGGEAVTLGSDAHSARDLGKGIEEAAELAQMAGIRYYATFCRRKYTAHKI